MAEHDGHWPRSRPNPTFPPLQSDKKGYNFNNNIMLAAIISLSVVVLLVILLHIYARWLLRRQAQRRDAIRRLGLMVAHDPSFTELTPKTGLDPSVISLLPVLAFKQPDPAQDGSSLTESATSAAVLECAVCLSVLEDGEMVRVLPNCKHMFHVECIDMWLGSHPTCPLCRTEAQPKPDEPTSEPCSPAAPPAERLDSSVSCLDDGSSRVPGKCGGSESRLSSFRRMLSRDTSSQRIQHDEYVGEDIERQ